MNKKIKELKKQQLRDYIDFLSLEKCEGSYSFTLEKNYIQMEVYCHLDTDRDIRHCVGCRICNGSVATAPGIEVKTTMPFSFSKKERRYSIPLWKLKKLSFAACGSWLEESHAHGACPCGWTTSYGTSGSRLAALEAAHTEMEDHTSRCDVYMSYREICKKPDYWDVERGWS
jgi:hypothetical protein